jgi:hypothetical protein
MNNGRDMSAEIDEKETTSVVNIPMTQEMGHAQNFARERADLENFVSIMSPVTSSSRAAGRPIEDEITGHNKLDEPEMAQAHQGTLANTDLGDEEHDTDIGESEEDQLLRVSLEQREGSAMQGSQGNTAPTIGCSNAETHHTLRHMYSRG